MTEYLSTRRYPEIGMALIRIAFGLCFFLIIASNFSCWRILWGARSAYSFDDMVQEQDRTGSVNLFLLSDSDWWTLSLLVASLVVSIFVMVGFMTRLSTIAMLALCWSFLTRNPLISDGGDNLMVISLLLLCFATTNERLSVDKLLTTRCGSFPRWKPLEHVLSRHSVIMGNLAWMALMFQICVVYVTAGFAKVRGSTWQEGTAIYYTLRSSEFSTWPALSQLFYQSGLFIIVATYLTVAVQVFFPFLVTHRVFKLPTVGFMLAMHLSIGILMGLPLFALVMISCEMIFVPDVVWSRVFCNLRSPGLR